MEYNKCIDHGWTDPKNNEIAFWCATKVDENNEYLYGKGHFGECDATCKKLGGLTRDISNEKYFIYEFLYAN